MNPVQYVADTDFGFTSVCLRFEMALLVLFALVCLASAAPQQQAARSPISNGKREANGANATKSAFSAMSRRPFKLSRAGNGNPLGFESNRRFSLPHITPEQRAAYQKAEQEKLLKDWPSLARYRSNQISARIFGSTL